MSCPACFEDYRDLGGDITPTELPCNCVLCSRCVGHQFEDGAVFCPLCCKQHRCNNAAQFPTVPIPSLQEDGGGNTPLPPSHPSVDTSQVRASTSQLRESNPRRVQRFLASLAVEEDASVATSARAEEGGGGGAAGSLCSSGWFGGRRSKLAVAVVLGAVGLITTVAIACRRRRL